MLFDPAPAITGIRPAAASTTISTQRPCSSWESVGDSPVVPTGTRPWLPSATCHSTSSASAFSSTLPSRNGVTSAGMEPLNMAASPGKTGASYSRIAPASQAAGYRAALTGR